MGTTRKEIDFTVAGGRVLRGDLYSPEGDQLHPIVIAIHGGGWNQGSRKAYQYWGPILARNGFALLAVDRWHFQPAETPYPTVVEDLRQAVRFVVSNAFSWGVDPGRVGLMGASSGAYISAMVALQQEENDPVVRSALKAVVAVYGVYDLATEWSFEQVTRPLDKSVEWLLGSALFDDRAGYFEASPLSYCIRSNNRIPFLVAWGTQDEVVDERLQSVPFARALTLAGFDVSTCILPNAQHYWLFEPHDFHMSHSAAFAPRLLRFLQNNI
jgi:acetyl esterase/lipase